MINFDVDMVIPFVDNTDEVWRNIYTKYCQETGNLKAANEINGQRFDNPGLFEYQLKCIDKFMPWIRTIWLIVSNKEQVPKYINKEKTKIILHSDIIPNKYLPTFNSTTIEMFIHNITGLSEYFIYANDDMYPITPLTKEDFFTEDGHLKINFTEHDYRDDCNKQFRRVCLNCTQHVLDCLERPHENKYYYLKPSHSMIPLKLSWCRLCFFKMWPFISSTIGPFRTEVQHNQYIYSVYAKYRGQTQDSNIRFKYVSIKRDFETVANLIKSKTYQIICINDVSVRDRNLNYNILKDAFDFILKE